MIRPSWVAERLERALHAHKTVITLLIVGLNPTEGSAFQL